MLVIDIPSPCDYNTTQYVKTQVDYGSYDAFTVRKGIPAEWTIVVPEGKLNGCNGEIVVPAYALSIPLHEGETRFLLPQLMSEQSLTAAGRA